MRLFGIIIFFSTLLFSNIGYISSIRGDVTIKRNNQIIQAFKRFKLENRDIISTGKRSKVQIIFKDRTVIRLGKSSTLNIEDYFFDKTSESKSTFSVIDGFFDVVTGQIGKIARDRFKLKTKTATIGVRGTHFQGYTIKGKDELKCLKGVITVQLKDSFFELKAGQKFSTSVNFDKFTSKKENNSNTDIEQNYKMELDKDVLDSLNQIMTDDKTETISTAYNLVQEIENPSLKLFAESEMFRRTYEVTLDSYSEYLGGRIDATDFFFDNSIAKIGYYKYQQTSFWIDGRDNYTNSAEVIAVMGGSYKTDKSIFKSWEGGSSNRKIINYKGYFLGSNYNFSKENTFNIDVDFGNRYLSTKIKTETGEEYKFITLNKLNQYGIDIYSDSLVVSNEDISNGTVIYSVFSYFYGQNIDQFAGSVYFSNSNNEYKDITFITTKDKVIDVYQKNISSDTIFSWGYWAYKDDEVENLRGGWLSPKIEITSKEKIDEYIEKSVKASYSGDIFGTVENIEQNNIDKIEKGSFNLHFDFMEKTVDGNFKFTARSKDIEFSNIKGEIDNSSFKFSNNHLIGDGKLYGKDAEYIGGGFQSTMENKDVVTAVFKGSKEK